MEKSIRALAEETVVAFWKQQDIFKKSREKDAPRGTFVFFEGPPTANAKPALHHLEARAFKDVIPRYKTMQGFSVRRRAGWDTHGLPVELQIEKKLGLSSKKEIEQYGVSAFNAECKQSVFTYIKEWETFTERIGYWVDEADAYYTFDATFMESLWYIIAQINQKGLLYKDYKVLPWCPRCGTALSSHELAQGYMDVKDLSVYALFRLLPQGTLISNDHTYIVAWTTTPWTLPGNVALAIGASIVYVRVGLGDKELFIAKERLSLLEGQHYDIRGEVQGSDLIGCAYEPLYPYLKELILAKEHSTEEMKQAFDRAYHIYDASFVTTTDGTGVVHIAPMYGADDFALATTYGLPKYHSVDDTGHFVAGMDFLTGLFVKDESVAVTIIKDLAQRGLLCKKEKYEHSYPHCWRCKTALVYYARDSWYIAMSKVREQLVSENQTINWEPSHIKDGRFGEWLRGINDWAISRERYWGTPLPVWISSQGDDRIVVDSVATIKQYVKKSGNTYVVARHGQTANNVAERWNCSIDALDPLTEQGKEGVIKTAQALKEQYGEFDVIVTSPFPRTKETTEIITTILGGGHTIQTDDRLVEWNVGPQYDGKSFIEFFAVRNASGDRYHFTPEGGESYAQVFTRSSEVLYDLEKKYSGKKILIITHGAVTRALELASRGARFDTMFETTREYKNFDNAEFREIAFTPLPHNERYELDLHRPYIDEVVLEKNGVAYYRTKEVMDVWFDSGAMPFAQDHYPFAQGTYDASYIDTKGIPADFICEAIDQTRGWFYTLHAIGVLMGKGKVYKNVICLGHLLDAEGKKMSKSVGNIIEPYSQLDTFGADVVRFWMYSVNQPGESKHYDPKTVAEIQNKVFTLYGNIVSFYSLYREKAYEKEVYQESHVVLDQWCIACCEQLIADVTQALDAYDIFKATRAIKDAIDTLSTWYVRRSRDRIKDGDKQALQTMYKAIKTIALVLAPFAPFTAETVWQEIRTDQDEESVHLAVWPTVVYTTEDSRSKQFEAMNVVRMLCTAGNAARKKSGIAVRQPLASVTSSVLIQKEYESLILDELNVKAVLHNSTLLEGEVVLDETITEDLRKEGVYRSLVRTVQDARKAQGLLPHDSITLTLPQHYEQDIVEYVLELQKTVQAKEIHFTSCEEPIVQIIEK